MKTHLGFRASERLQEAIDRVGDASAAVRGLIILGLFTAGHDVSSLAKEARIALAGIEDPAVEQALLDMLHNRATPVIQVLNTPQLQFRKEQEEEEADPFASIGIAV